MSEALRLITHLESIGHGLTLEGKNLRIVRGNHLPSSFREEIATYKKEILSIFQRDAEAKAAHFIVGLPGTLYMRSISRFSTVYIECEAGQCEVWRETYQQGRTTASSFKTIVPPSSFGAALMEAEKYFHYIERMNKRIS